MTEILDVLAAWIPTQRWFGRKSHPPQFRLAGGWSLDDPEREVGIRVHLILDTSGQPTLYQVPVTSHRSPLAETDAALIGSLPEEDGGTRYLYDGPHDPAYARALLRLIMDEQLAAGEPESPGTELSGHREPGIAAGTISASRVLSGEQSNTSIIYDVDDAHGVPAQPVICKVFRVLATGENPDVILQSALGRVACPHIPRSIGHAVGQWRDPSHASGLATGHLAFAQEFLPGAEDGWRIALGAAAVGKDFTGAAFTLGSATADVHAALAAAMPSHEASPADIAGFVAAMRGRLFAAIAEVPSLAVYRESIEAIFATAQTVPWPQLQRIHGDYHLGQVLATPNAGWMLVDFEGEPLRPMTERSEPDVALRDIAGMLRSFDYVAGSLTQAQIQSQAQSPVNSPAQWPALSDPQSPAPPHIESSLTPSLADWASTARGAFLRGYREHSGHDLTAHEILLNAFELDKALYEVVYEARHRPSWLPIPIEAIQRLVMEWENSPMGTGSQAESSRGSHRPE